MGFTAIQDYESERFQSASPIQISALELCL